MKKLCLLLAIAALTAGSAQAREVATGVFDIPTDLTTSRAADILLEYDGDAFVTYGTSPGWTDDEVTNFEIPAGGPYVVSEVWYYIVGAGDSRDVEFWGGFGLSDPPDVLLSSGPSFSLDHPVFPPADWTIVDVTGEGIGANSGDILRPGVLLLGNGDGIGLAGYMDDGNPGHSWALYAGAWTDDTYTYGYDAGIRLGINAGGTPTIETTWGSIKAQFE